MLYRTLPVSAGSFGYEKDGPFTHTITLLVPAMRDWDGWKQLAHEYPDSVGDKSISTRPYTSKNLPENHALRTHRPQAPKKDRRRSVGRYGIRRDLEALWLCGSRGWPLRGVRPWEVPPYRHLPVCSSPATQAQRPRYGRPDKGRGEATPHSSDLGRLHNTAHHRPGAQLLRPPETEGPSRQSVPPHHLPT